MDWEATNVIDWWNNSPRQEPDKKIWEIAYKTRDGKRLVAQRINLSNPAKPQILDQRLVAEDLNGGGVEMSIAGDIFVWDYAEAYLFTIPDGGLGVANWDTRYPVKVSNNNCAMKENRASAKNWLTNTNIRNHNCSPGDHNGFFTFSTRKVATPFYPLMIGYGLLNMETKLFGRPKPSK